MRTLCPELTSDAETLLCRDPQAISQLMAAVCLEQENDPEAYPWHKQVVSSIQSLRHKSAEPFPELRGHPRGKEWTFQLLLLQRSMWLCHGAMMMIANFCGKFSGQGMMPEEPARKCDHCGTPLTQVKKCSRCKHAFYCSRDCQVYNWNFHKKDCARIVKELEQQKQKQEKEKEKENENESESPKPAQSHDSASPSSTD